MMDRWMDECTINLIIITIIIIIVLIIVIIIRHNCFFINPSQSALFL